MEYRIFLPELGTQTNLISLRQQVALSTQDQAIGVKLPFIQQLRSKLYRGRTTHQLGAIAPSQDHQ